MTQKITPFLWFNGELGDALEFYGSVFPDFEVVKPPRTAASCSPPPGAWATSRSRGMNAEGGPAFTEAISLYVDCVDQAEVDRYWDALLADGGRESQCGWLVDRFGVSWQVVPRRIIELLEDPDPGRAQRAMAEMMTQVKLDVARVEAAADGTLG